jgi:cell division protein FtsL
MKAGKGRLTFFAVLGFIIVSMGFSVIFGDRGLLHLQKLRVELATIEAATDDLAKENKRLAREIDLLKNNSRYIEKVAREELGLVKGDEIVYKRLKE